MGKLGYTRLIVPFMERDRYDREREIVDKARRERENHAFEEHMMGMHNEKPVLDTGERL